VHTHTHTNIYTQSRLTRQAALQREVRAVKRHAVDAVCKQIKMNKINRSHTHTKEEQFTVKEEQFTLRG